MFYSSNRLQSFAEALCRSAGDNNAISVYCQITMEASFVQTFPLQRKDVRGAGQLSYAQYDLLRRIELPIPHKYMALELLVR